MLSVTYTKNSSASASQVQLKVLHTHDVTILNCRNRRDSPSWRSPWQIQTDMCRKRSL